MTMRHRSAKTTATGSARVERPMTLHEAAIALGLDRERAATFAAGRSGTREPASLYALARERGMIATQATTFARGRAGLHEADAPTKHEPANGSWGGGDFVRADYAYTPSDPETWQLLITTTPGGVPDGDSVRAAVNAIDTTSSAVPTPSIPEEDMPSVLATLSKAWVAAGLGELPPVLSAAALESAFRQLGHTSEAARIAARGRDRRF